MKPSEIKSQIWRNGSSLTQIARTFGVSRAYVNQVTKKRAKGNAKQPQIKAAIARLIGRSVEEIFDDQLDPNIIGEQICRVRSKLGLSQKELGEELGINQTTICRVETGAQPARADLIVAISEFTGLSVYWFLGKNLPARDAVKDDEMPLQAG